MNQIKTNCQNKGKESITGNLKTINTPNVNTTTNSIIPNNFTLIILSTLSKYGRTQHKVVQIGKYYKTTTLRFMRYSHNYFTCLQNFNPSTLACIISVFFDKYIIIIKKYLSLYFNCTFNCNLNCHCHQLISIMIYAMKDEPMINQVEYFVLLNHCHH